MIGVLLFSIVVSVRNAAEVVDVTCETTVAGYFKEWPSVSTAPCRDGYTLVGCNSIGEHPHEVVGSWVDGDVCSSSAGQGGPTTGAKAAARCCKLPKCSTCNAATATGDGVSIAQCGPYEELTGCAAHTTNVDTGKFRVGAAGNDPSGWENVASIDAIKNTFISTENTCSASGYTLNTNNEYLQSTASCCSLPPNYVLECKSQWAWQTVTSQMACPAGFMTSCVARNNYAYALDYYYVDSSGKCKTQMNNGEPQWVQAICCTLTKTGPDQACCGEDEDCPGDEVCCKAKKTCHAPPN